MYIVAPVARIITVKIRISEKKICFFLATTSIEVALRILCTAHSVGYNL